MQPIACRRRVLRLADDLHDLVDIVDGDLEAFENVLALERLLELELGAADDDLVTMRDEVHEHLAECHHLRHELLRRRIGHEREHDHAERRLHRGVLVQLIEHHARNRVSFELDDDSRLVRGLVAEIRDPLELLVSHQLGDRLD